MQTAAPKTWYVYTYSYPDGTVFYVGKGTKGRIDHHEREAQGKCSCKKCQAIRHIWASGNPVQKRIVFETLVEVEALEQERSLIEKHTGPLLANVTIYPRAKIVKPKPVKSKIDGVPKTKIVDDETYLTANEAAKRLGIVRDTFQRNVAPHLTPYVFGALRWTYYKQSDVDRFAGPRPKETEGKDQ